MIVDPWGVVLAQAPDGEGVALAETLAGQAGHVNYDVVPWVIYTSPEIAWAGLTEKGAKEQGLSVRWRRSACRTARSPPAPSRCR